MRESVGQVQGNDPGARHLLEGDWREVGGRQGPSSPRVPPEEGEAADQSALPEHVDHSKSTLTDRSVPKIYKYTLHNSYKLQPLKASGNCSKSTYLF